MKTFRELIAWELEQDRKQKNSDARHVASADKLSEMMMRKLKYLNSNPTERPLSSAYETAQASSLTP